MKVSNCQIPIQLWVGNGGTGEERQERGVGRLRGLGSIAPPSLPQQGAGAVGPHEVMGVQGAQGGPRSGPLSPSLAVAVSQSPPAGAAAFGGVGNPVGLVMGPPPLPGAHREVLPTSEPTQGFNPMDHPLVWPFPIIP